MPRTSDCATRSTTGHVSPPSAIPSVVPDILQCANVATRTVVLSVVSRIDCLPWHASFCSDRRCLIRTLADLPNNGGHYSKRAKTSRGHGEVSLFGRSLAIFLTALCSTRRRRGRHGWDALRPDQHLAVMARRSGQGMKPRAARACARPLTAPSTMTLRKQPNRAKCPVNCRIRRSLERVRSNSSAGYRPATFPLDSQVGSLAARPIASSSTAVREPWIFRRTQVDHSDIRIAPEGGHQACLRVVARLRPVLRFRPPQESRLALVGCRLVRLLRGATACFEPDVFRVRLRFKRP